ncbi:MAG: Gfo/Idh/MocA family oxidoreductase [Planctomycetota bacterium]
MARKKTYGFGVVGAGMIAGFHAAAIRDLKNARLVAFADVVEAAAKARGQEFGVDYYSDFNKMFERDDIDVVSIGTPSGIHLEPAVAAARAGKHVIVEKPLEVTPERCDKIIAACRKAKVKCASIFPSRFKECNIFIKQAVEEGRFGRITVGDTYVKWWRSQQYYDSGGWRGTWKYDGGGALMNQSIHNVDLLQWFMGPVESIMAYTDCLAHKRIEVEDTAVAILRFKSGALGVIEGTTSIYPGLLKRIEIHGDKGTAIAEEEDIIKWEFEKALPVDKKIAKMYAKRVTKGGAVSDPKAISHIGHMKQFADFLDAIEKDREPFVNGPEGRKSVEIICAIYKAAQTGKEVRLPLKK